MNQLESRKLYKVHPSREGADNSFLISDQSDPRYRIYRSGKLSTILSLPVTKPSLLLYLSVSSLPFCKLNPVTSGSPSRKRFSILDMSRVMDDPVMEESFRRLVKEFAAIGRVPFGRSRPVRREQAKRPRRLLSEEATDRRKVKNATIIANFRKQRMIKTQRPINQVNRVSIGQRIVAKDKKSLPVLVGILDAETLSELSDEDATLRLMKLAIRNRDYDGCIIIDETIAIPSCLQRLDLSCLHRSNLGQEAIVDSAQHLWWPRIHRDIVNLCKN